MKRHALKKPTWWRRPQLVFAIVMALALAVNIVAMWPRRQPPAPTAQFTMIDGSVTTLAALAGRPVLVVFWATTCKTCIAEVPDLNRLYADLRPRGLELIAVAMPYDPPTRVYEFVKKLPITYPVALDIDGEITRAFDKVTLTPTAWLITPVGRVAWKKTGPLDLTRLRVDIAELIEHPERTF